MKKYKVSFTGTNHFMVIEASTMSEAKALFAKAENVAVSAYIKASKTFSYQEAR